MHPSHTENELKIDYIYQGEIPETPIYPVMNGQTNLSTDAEQVFAQHPALSQLETQYSGDGPTLLTIPPRLTLPIKQKILQDDGPQLFVTSTNINAPGTPLPYSHQLLNRERERLVRGTIQRTFLVPVEEPISNIDTVLMLAVSPGEVARQQQDVLINSLVEDITCQTTLQLPRVLASEQQSLSDQRHVITSTAGSAAIAGIGNLIFAVLKYATNVVITNIVTQSVYGVFVTISTSATIAGYIAALGLDTTIVRFLSMYRAKGEHGLAAGLIRFVMRMTLISGVLCSVLFYFSASAIAHLVYHQDAYALPLKEVALLVPLITLQLALTGGLMALKEIRLKVYVGLIQPMLFLVLVGVFYLLKLRLEALILATICGFLASVITGQVLLRKASKQLVCNAVPSFEPKKWLRFALPISLGSLIQNVLNSTDILFLTAFASATQVGLYAAADRTSILVAMPLLALNTIFSPMIAEYYAHGEHEQLASLSKVVAKWSFSLSLPMFLCLSIFHQAILSIFSKGYTDAGIVLIILSLGNLIDAGAGSVGYLLSMTGHSRVALTNTIMTVAVNIGLGFWLVPRFNVIGAAVAAALTVIILNVTALIEVYLILKIVTFRWDMLKSVIAGCVASIIGLLLLHIVHVGYGYQAIFGALSLIIPFMLVYILVLALLRFSEEDLMVFDAIRAKFSKK